MLKYIVVGFGRDVSVQIGVTGRIGRFYVSPLDCKVITTYSQIVMPYNHFHVKCEWVSCDAIANVHMDTRAVTMKCEGSFNNSYNVKYIQSPYCGN